MLAVARARGVRETVIGCAEQLPFPSASFDCVSMGYMLRHIEDLHTVFAETSQLQAPHLCTRLLQHLLRVAQHYVFFAKTRHYACRDSATTSTTLCTKLQLQSLRLAQDYVHFSLKLNTILAQTLQLKLLHLCTRSCSKIAALVHRLTTTFTVLVALTDSSQLFCHSCCTCYTCCTSRSLSLMMSLLDALYSRGMFNLYWLQIPDRISAY